MRQVGPMLIIAALLVFVIAPMGLMHRGSFLNALYVAAAVLFIILGFLLYKAFLDAYTESATEQDYAQTKWMLAFASLDEEGKQAVAMRYPKMRYRITRGVPRAFFEDTAVPMEMFHRFLGTSNREFISPERDWYTAEQPRWAWLEIKGCLEDNNKIVPDSAAGSHSWRWNGNSYQHLCAYWMAGRKLMDLNAAEEAQETDARQYATDDDLARL